MEFYLGGYHLLKPKPLSFGSHAGQIVFTASDCINESLIGGWAYPWNKKARKDSAYAEEIFGIDRERVELIRRWIGEKFESNSIGWESVFMDKHSAIECKEKFFTQVQDAFLLAIYFNEEERNELLSEFKPESEAEGEVGVYQILMTGTLETKCSSEDLMGFDLIGMEYGGAFHTFRCHEMAGELIEKFGLRLNEFGLFDEPDSWHEILNFMNDEETGCEPVPWYVAKVKKVRF
jgi:hypothetical protein